MKNGNNNKLNILEAIKRYGPVTIKDVAALSMLSIPSTTSIIDMFIEDGLLFEELSTENASGRPPKLIRIKSDYGFTIGVDMGMIDSANVGFFCAGGKLITKFRISLISSADNDVISSIIDEIKSKITEFKGKHGKLMNIVIGNPGIVNPETGSLTDAAQGVSWAHLPLTEMFTREFKTVTITYNDINLSALGEKMFGAGKGYSNLVLMRADIGIKAGVIIDGSLYLGETGAAGEIGRNVIVHKDSATGRLTTQTAESHLSLNSIMQRISEELQNNPDDLLNTLVGADRSLMTLDHIIKALDSGNSFVSNIIEEAGTLLGCVIANMATTLDIGIVIIGGDIVKLEHHIFKPVRETAALIGSTAPTIIPSVLGEDVALWGAAQVGWEYYTQKLSKILVL